MKTKYLIMDNMGMFGTNEGFVIFPEFQDHKVMADKLGGKEHVLGAGFINFYKFDYETKVSCYGYSESLKIGPRDNDDEKIIEILMR